MKEHRESVIAYRQREAEKTVIRDEKWRRACELRKIKDAKRRLLPKPIPSPDHIPDGFKWCPRCGISKKKVRQYWDIDKAKHDMLCAWCKECKKQYDETPDRREKRLAKAREWKKRNKDRVREYNKKYKNAKISRSKQQSEVAWIERNQKLRIKQMAKAKDALADSYIKQSLRKSFRLKAGEITEEMIQLRREQLQITRLIRQVGQEKGVQDGAS